MEASNIKAMHDAIEAINCINIGGLKRLLCELVEEDIFDGGLINRTISAVEKARRALSAPLRNCDVGTAEEQTDRYKTLCRAQKNCNSKCPVMEWRGTSFANCEIAWAQMPYQPEEGGAK